MQIETVNFGKIDSWASRQIYCQKEIQTNIQIDRKTDKGSQITQEIEIYRQ